MGNNVDKDKYYMHVKFIGSNMGNFYANFDESEYLKKIKKLWNIEPPNTDNKQTLEQIDDYFERLNNLIESGDSQASNIREGLIVKVDNLKSKEVDKIIEQMDNLIHKYRMPLVLFLTAQKGEKKSNFDIKDYSSIDLNLIFIKDYTEDKKSFEEKIAPMLVRFCSIHNDLGDKFSLFGKHEDTFDLIENAFPFTLNIACIGEIGHGKSTGVNIILNEYKAKETNKGFSQTKNLVAYNVENRPIRIIDIPGFESENTVKEAINKFKDCEKDINYKKECIHIILYFKNYSKIKETRAFSEMEFKMLEQITGHKSSKLIYVITRGKQNLNKKKKNIIFDTINSGLQGGAIKNKAIKDNLDMLKANENNVIFVNFRVDDDNPVIFGKKELFKKIYDFFIESKSYKESNEDLNDIQLEEKIESLKAKARYEMLPEKFYAGLAGIIPFADIAIQKFVLNKRAIKKAGQIFGIEAKFIDEENEKEKLKKNEEEKKKLEEEKKRLEEEMKKLEEEKKLLEEQNNKIKENKNEPFYIKPDIEKKNLITSTDGDELLKETKPSKATKVINNTIRVGTLAKEADNIMKLSNYYSRIDDLYKKIDFLEKTYGTITDCGKNLVPVLFDTDSHQILYDNLLEKLSVVEGAGSGAKGFLKFFGIGTLISIGFGVYTTHKFCEDLLNKFADYYRKNAGKISNSYESAISYFRDYKDE